MWKGDVHASQRDSAMTWATQYDMQMSSYMPGQQHWSGLSPKPSTAQIPRTHDDPPNPHWCSRSSVKRSSLTFVGGGSTLWGEGRGVVVQVVGKKRKDACVEPNCLLFGAAWSGMIRALRLGRFGPAKTTSLSTGRFSTSQISSLSLKKSTTLNDLLFSLPDLVDIKNWSPGIVHDEPRSTKARYYDWIFRILSWFVRMARFFPIISAILLWFKRCRRSQIPNSVVRGSELTGL